MPCASDLRFPWAVRVRKGLLTLGLIGVVAGLLTAASGGWAQRTGSAPLNPAAAAQPVPLVVYPPMGLPGLHLVVDGRPQGLYPDLIEALSRTSGLRMVVRSVPWPEPLEAVRAGRGDILGPVMGQPSTFSDLVHTEPLMRVEWARYVRRGDSRTNSGIAYQGVRFAVLADSVGTRWLRREHPSVIQVPVESIADGLMAVVDGQADAFLGLRLPTRRLVQMPAYQAIEEVGTELTAPMSLGLAPASAHAIPALNAAIQALAAQGEFEALLKRWMPPAPPSEAEVIRRRLGWVLSAMGLMLLALTVVLWRRNQQLRRAVQQADEARQAKSDFLAVVSHEIRTPINGLVNLIDLLQRGSTTREQADLLQQAERANRALLGLVNQVLDYSKIEASLMELQPHPMRLDDLIDQVEAILKAQTRATAVGLVIERPSEPLPPLMADEQRLAQVLINLGGNALKFTTQGQVVLRVSTLQPSRDEQGRWRLRFEVADTGPGIPADQLERLFQPFVQLRSGLNRPHAGTGLGLSTSRELVRQMGSQLELHSVPQRLTRFWFDVALPPSAAPTPERRPPDPALSALGPRLPGCCVMVVDDNPLNLLVTRKILEQEGARVVQAGGFEDAQIQLQQGPSPDVILMDLHMPQVDGLEAMRRLSSLWGTALPPVLAVSGAVTEDLQREVRAAGMVGFVPKPFERQTLLRAIEALQIR